MNTAIEILKSNHKKLQTEINDLKSRLEREEKEASQIMDAIETLEAKDKNEIIEANNTFQSNEDPKKKDGRKIIQEREALQIEPLKCGLGTRQVSQGTNLHFAISAIQGRSPHWLSTEGIVDAIVSLGFRPISEMPNGITAILHGDLKKVRNNYYKVSGIEFRMVDRKFLYRIINNETPK